MHVYRLYVPVQPKVGIVSLHGDTAHRLINVLRLRPGDAFALTDGKGNEMRSRLIKAQRDEALVEIYEVTQPSREPKGHICLAITVLKGERFDWLIQKAVELGVREILPLLTRNCVVRISRDDSQRKQKRWLSIAISAMEQSGGCVLPIIHEPTSLSEALARAKHFDARIMLHEGAERALHQAVGELVMAKSAVLFVGPEGGFDDAEVEEAVSHGVVAVNLGRRILRSETAAIVGTAIILHHLEKP
ncbi:MAG: 16S rRNA (uracil(1498)-N(3))-methyltransferase [Armatimonadota bacterium]|nr:16S rRNA (uracil(1498)-N(3))-methyltransferase [Armatimonadota bacterium]MCX7777284.1 16S rRNA (uracil(1498)-N(3))-methyltransferase [Armatimonadota bacterium]MDW8024399.1 16S rRNA (uracil(1498)-N(3))-methyltransferase [Armatimonadota bacterium]